MNLDTLWQSLEASQVGSFVAESAWAFPTIESIHVIAIVTVVGTIAIMDLRLLGLTSPSCAVTATSRDTLPWTWGAFVIALITGLLLFVSKATNYAANPYFQLKMVMLVLAGLNMALFHSSTWRSVRNWDTDCVVPLGGKIAGALSLFFWILVVFFGRAIGFTLGVLY
ncbi:MAG: hypothetical protein JWM38_64 [Sphingomonas bacterium]|jgi:hypothetical protein|nr:hypothetical protein [Sphingomonas bacterium]